MEWKITQNGVKFTQSYLKVYSISSKILLFLQNDPLFYSLFFTVYA